MPKLEKWEAIIKFNKYKFTTEFNKSIIGFIYLIIKLLQIMLLKSMN